MVDTGLCEGSQHTSMSAQVHTNFLDGFHSGRTRNAPTVRPYHPVGYLGALCPTSSLHLVEDPYTPNMSGYGYPSSYPEQPDFSSYTTAYPGFAPYTQTRMNEYFAQYQCYLPQPYQILPDFYTQPIAQPVRQLLPRTMTQHLPTALNACQPIFDVPLNYEEPRARWSSQASPNEQLQSIAQTQSQSHNQSLER
ncbi:uncharacterized protein M421DRAFT_90264 [Didymella exigua CBS 183.55]|uniref:Uncharacterized protein n=1 Tax=Didymella exigua CBS 183.55 TaxID=1150837 RepID=A0A6A5RUK9_9PLEO|nr:uncharacterized protein M421DRAFT_90264 [Didymella exigua CBS 183.55]KAF1931173.1 hypothetical protein M421DRAFT_90264 [Didymella exigua CBS 183.55]